jgi:transposase InsO family protein
MVLADRNVGSTGGSVRAPVPIMRGIDDGTLANWVAQDRRPRRGRRVAGAGQHRRRPHGRVGPGRWHPAPAAQLDQKGKRPVVPDRVRRQFTAVAPDVLWCGDITEVSTDEGKPYLATVIDLHSRRLLGYAMSAHHDAELTQATQHPQPIHTPSSPPHRRGLQVR